MSSRSIAYVTAVCVALLWAGCVGDVVTKSASEIYDESDNATFDKLAQRQLVPDQADVPETVQGPSTQYEEPVTITTESRCHAGDLDNGLVDFWAQLGQGLAGLAYTFSLEAADGTLLGSVTLGTDQLISPAQQQGANVQNQATATMTVRLPDSLKQAGSFYANLFACVDADKDGACADEEVKPVDEGGAASPLGSRLLASVALKANVADGKLSFGPADNQQADETAFWQDASKFAEDLLKNLAPTNGDAPLSLMLAVRSGDEACRAQAGLPPADNTAPVGGTGTMDGAVAGGGNAGTGTVPAPNAGDMIGNIFGNVGANLGGAGTGIGAVAGNAAAGANFGGGAMAGFLPRTNGCFVSGTMIRVGNGHALPIEQLVAGSSIATADDRALTSLRAVAGPEAEPVVVIESSKGHVLSVTSKHPVMTKAGLKLAKDVVQSDRLLTADGDYVKITTIKHQPYSGMVYNFALPGQATKDHLIIAEGLVVGDLYLQEKLTRR